VVTFIRPLKSVNLSERTSIVTEGDFGPLSYSSIIRKLILSMTAIAVGVQLAFSAFLLSIVQIPTK